MDDFEKTFEISVVNQDFTKLGKSEEPSLKVGIDMGFNKIRDVQKVNFSDIAPDYREVKDGLNWISYCENKPC